MTFSLEALSSLRLHMVKEATSSIFPYICLQIATALSSPGMWPGEGC
jgi:hypothetical protein